MIYLTFAIEKKNIITEYTTNKHRIQNEYKTNNKCGMNH